MKCEFGGAGVLLFFWAVAISVPQAFERELGEFTGFAILILGIVGIWAGLATRRACRQTQRPT